MAQKISIDLEKISSTNPRHHAAWIDAMGLLRFELDSAQLRREFITWATAQNLPNIEYFSALDDYHYITLGRMAWLLNNGAEMPSNARSYMQKLIDRLNNSHQSDVEIETVPVLSAEQRRTLQYVDLYSRIDAARMQYQNDIDTLEQQVRKLFNNDVPMNVIKKLYVHFKDSLDDALLETDNPEVNNWIEPLITVVNILAASTGNARSMQAMQRKINKRAERAAKNASVKLHDQETNIVSLSPAMLVDNSHALLYNAKNRKVILYTAKTGEKLGIKGTYITGYDESQSFGKTLRKPKETFSKILYNTSFVRIQQILTDYVKGKTHAVNGKLNKETLLIKVFK